MDEKKKDLDELADLKDFDARFNHYLNADNEEVKPEIREYEDISSYSGECGDFFSSDEQTSDAQTAEEDDEPVIRKRFDDSGNFFTRNRYKNTKIIALCVVIALLLTSAGFLIWIIVSTRSNGYGDNGIDFADEIDDSNYLVDDDHNFQIMGDIDANSLQSFLYEWANNGGEKMYSKNVINVLLCGVDSVYNLCDAQILVSVNKKTEKITMVSFLRDSWSYIKMPRSNGTTYDYYNKVNASYHGGPATLMETIENNYKIEIDQYIVVDFESFPKLIDALGGVTVEVQQYESDYIRRTSKQKDFPVGKSKLNGKQALIFSRIRKSDADNDLSRTRRQRMVIKALIESAKTATKGQLVNAFKQVSGYLRTGYTQSEVLSLIAQAYSHDWMDFEITEVTMPNEDYVERIGGMIGSAWAWTVDYPICAQRIQKLLYGSSNIILNDDRVSPLDFVSNKRNTSSTSGSSSSSSSSSYSGSSYSYNKTTKNYDYNDNSGSGNNEDTNGNGSGGYEEQEATQAQVVTQAPTQSVQQTEAEPQTPDSDSAEE